LQRKKDYRPTRVFGSMWAPLKTAQPPFNDLRVRYALNMATDKVAIADIIPGQSPAIGLVPQMRGYEPNRRLTIAFRNSESNVLSFDPRGARELLESAIGRSPLRVRYTHPPLPHFQLAGLILQQHWRQTLGIEMELALRDVATWVQVGLDKTYPGIVATGDI